MNEKIYHFATFYQFTTLKKLGDLKAELESFQQDVLGLIILAEEGINGTVAGSREHIKALINQLQKRSSFQHLELKYSQATMKRKPFRKLKIKIKAEIVTMGTGDLDTPKFRGEYVEPADWNSLIQDPTVLLIDTRNVYEYRIGTFKGAVNPQTLNFRQFPQAIKGLIRLKQPKKVALFCTGGIRCEKATAYIKQQGVDEVYHLHGGILKYFENISTADSLWDGKCFVFDGRITVNQDLAAEPEPLCKVCGQVMLKDPSATDYRCYQCIEYPIKEKA